MLIKANNDDFWKDIFREDLVEGIKNGTHTMKVIGDDDYKIYLVGEKGKEEGFTYHFIML